MTAGTSILVVEDERHTAELIATYLEREGYRVHRAEDGREGLRLARRMQPALVILDLMLPAMDGLEVCKRLRTESDVPIIMLTARGEELDRLVGFALGTDDYVVKPFSPRELVERVKAILRRSRAGPAPRAQPLAAGGLVLEPDKRKASLHGRPLHLTDKEYRLLHLMMSQPGRVYERTVLLDHLNPRGELVVERAIDVHVGNLRQKLGESSSNPRFIETVRGVGYRFSDQLSDAEESS